MKVMNAVILRAVRSVIPSPFFPLEYPMRAVAIVVTLILAFLGVVLGALRYLDYTENPRSSFTSFAEMEAAGMIAAGWLPKFLPRSATHIEESHHIDTNTVWASFKYQVGDLQAVEGACEKIVENKQGKKYLCPPLDTRTSTIILDNNGTGYYLSYENGI